MKLERGKARSSPFHVVESPKDKTVVAFCPLNRSKSMLAAHTVPFCCRNKIGPTRDRRGKRSCCKVGRPLRNRRYRYRPPVLRVEDAEIGDILPGASVCIHSHNTVGKRGIAVRTSAACQRRAITLAVDARDPRCCSARIRTGGRGDLNADRAGRVCSSGASFGNI